jgi:alcohol dehydrogenase class IV
MSFMLALPKISLHGAGAIGDMVKLVAGKRWGKALIVTDGQLVKLGLLDSLFPRWMNSRWLTICLTRCSPTPPKRWCKKATRRIGGRVRLPYRLRRRQPD